MENFWAGFEKKAKAKKEEKSTKGTIFPSVSGAILGYGAGTFLGRHAYPGRATDWTSLAGAVAGSRAGDLLYNKMLSSRKDADNE